MGQAYGGGGNTGATLKNDFVELFNAGNAAVSLAGWSVQYNSTTGTGTWQKTISRPSCCSRASTTSCGAAGTGGSQDLPTPQTPSAASS